MAGVHLLHPLEAGAPGERSAELLPSLRPVLRELVGEFRRGDEREKQRRSGQVGNAEPPPDEVIAFELGLDSVEGSDGSLAAATTCRRVGRQ